MAILIISKSPLCRIHSRKLIHGNALISRSFRLTEDGCTKVLPDFLPVPDISLKRSAGGHRQAV